MATYSAPSLPPQQPRTYGPDDWSLLPTVERRPVRPQGLGVLFALLAILVALILPVLASMH
jgi:hypothetical protein